MRIAFMSLVSFAATAWVTAAHASQWANEYAIGAGGGVGQIEETTDGGYIGAGWVKNGSGDLDAWIVKIDGTGKVIWQKAYGTGNDDQAVSIRKAADNGYIFAGGTGVPGTSVYQIWACRIDGSGKVIWQKTYSGSTFVIGRDLIPAKDGGYVLIDSQASVMKIDSAGKIVWQRLYASIPYYPNIGMTSIKMTADGGYVAVGLNPHVDAISGRAMRDNFDVFVLRLRADGSAVWMKNYDSGIDDVPNEIQLTKDGGFVVSGYTAASVSDRESRDAFAMKLSSSGSVVWQKSFGASGEDGFYPILENQDGSFLTAGFSEAADGGAWLAKLSAKGTIAWQKAYWEHAFIYCILPVPDGGYLMSAQDPFFGAPPILLKTDSTGALGAQCGERSTNNKKIQLRMKVTTLQPYLLATRYTSAPGKAKTKTQKITVTPLCEP